MDMNLCPPDQLLLVQVDINLCPPEKLIPDQWEIKKKSSY